MSHKQSLKQSIYVLLKRCNTGSYASKADRWSILKKVVNDLRELDINLSHCDYLKPSHIEKLVEYWIDSNVAVSTIKNRMSVIRFLFEALKKAPLPDNKAFGIANRSYVPTRNRAIVNPDFSLINNEYVRISLELQKHFGLRREESLKIKPHLADKGNTLQLLPSWCKGSRGRFIPITTDEQSYWLDAAKKLAGDKEGSLIPPDKSYAKQKFIYDKQVARANLHNPHGLRHAYAQRRYKELTGWEAPINGGPAAKQLTPEQKAIDKAARIEISEALGHSRPGVTVNYCA